MKNKPWTSYEVHRNITIFVLKQVFENETKTKGTRLYLAVVREKTAILWIIENNNTYQKRHRNIKSIE